MKKWLIFSMSAGFCAILSALSHVVAADETLSSGNSEMALDQELLWLKAELTATVEAYTDLATKTTLSADQVPGMVSVLRGKDLEAQGIRSLIEAFSLIQGVNPSFTTPVVRGIEVWGSGKLKMLLNGVSFNPSLYASPTAVYQMPIEMIDHIEMIRGPGSAVYGEYAYVGVINVVTRQEGKRVFASYGSYDTYAGGGHYAYADPNKDLKFSLNLAGFARNGEDLTSGPDALYFMSDVLHGGTYSQPEASHAPGHISAIAKRRSGVVTLNHKSLSLLGQYMYAGFGDGLGDSTSVLPAPEDRIQNEESHWAIQAKHEWELSPVLKGDIKLGWFGSSFVMDKIAFYPPGACLAGTVIGPEEMQYLKGVNDPQLQGLLGALSPVPGAKNRYCISGYYFPEGVIGSNYAEESRFYTNMDATWKGWKDHIVSMGLEWTRTELVDAWTEANVHPLTMEATPWKRAADEDTWIKKGVQRKIGGMMLQDQIAINKQSDITLGLRFDHYDDVGSALTPRIAAVTRLTKNHILKAQYGKAFRPPTFMEMYTKNFVISGNPKIKPETIDSYELGYIYRDLDRVARVTLFYSELNDMIELVDGPNGQLYANNGEAVLKGVELEMEKSLTDQVKLYGNVSYVDPKNKVTGMDITNSTNWLGNVGVIYQPLPDYALSVRHHYVGERNRAPGDSRDKLGADNTIDLTGSMFNIWQKGITLRIGASNLFDEKVMAPASERTYPQDYPRPGRYLWTKISYDF